MPQDQAAPQQNQAFGNMDPAAKMQLLRMLRMMGSGSPNNVPQHPAGNNTQQLMANEAAARGGQPDGSVAPNLMDVLADKIIAAMGLGGVESQQRGKEAMAQGVVDVSTPVPGVNQ